MQTYQNIEQPAPTRVRRKRKKFRIRNGYRGVVSFILVSLSVGGVFGAAFLMGTLIDVMDKVNREAEESALLADASAGDISTDSEDACTGSSCLTYEKPVDADLKYQRLLHAALRPGGNQKNIMHPEALEIWKTVEAGEIARKQQHEVLMWLEAVGSMPYDARLIYLQRLAETYAE